MHQRSATGAQVVPRPAPLDLDESADAWNALAVAGGSIFSTWDWAAVWWRHYGAGRELLLHGCRSADGRLASVLPLYSWHGRWPRVLRFLGHGPGDELGPVHAGDADDAAGALRAALDQLDWDVFLGEQLPGDEAWSDRLGARTWRRESSPVLRIPDGGWEEYLETRSSNFRQQLKGRKRALARAGDVRIRLADDESLERDLDALFALHRARWMGKRTDFSDTPFHRDLARSALRRGWLRLWLLELDGNPVAAWHGFQVGSVASYYQAGRDPAYERLSVGFALMAHTIRAAMEEGASEYRMGRGAERFKFRFTAQDPGLETAALVRGLVWSASYRLAAAARRARKGGRRWMARGRNA